MRASSLHAASAAAAAVRSTVDGDEIRRFAKLSAQWWAPGGPYVGLHAFNAVRVPVILGAALDVVRRRRNLDVASVVEPHTANSVTAGGGIHGTYDTRDVHRHVLSGLRVVDIGCGGGILSEVRVHLRFAAPWLLHSGVGARGLGMQAVLLCAFCWVGQALGRLGATVVGLDACEESVEAAKAHASTSPELQQRLSYQCGTAEDLVVGKGDCDQSGACVSSLLLCLCKFPSPLQCTPRPRPPARPQARHPTHPLTPFSLFLSFLRFCAWRGVCWCTDVFSSGPL
jgi:2-polyprenyl-3-methyl-5-hydroxy-6-metoxy-1,4-benzoquinol methylase